MAKQRAAKASTLVESTPHKKRNGGTKKGPIITASRQDARCKRCPGRPLRSQCIHTKKGQQYIAEQQALQSLREPSVDAMERGSASASENDERPEISAPLTGPEDHPTSSASATVPSTTFPSISAPGTPTSSSLLQETASISSMTSSSLAQLTLRTRTTPSHPKPPRTSAQNPYHGYVQGALRGTEVYQIVRGHSLPSPISENTRLVKQFTNSINAIVEKCEDLSKQTGCWLFIGAQHATARSGAISYASPRLRRDAAAQAGNIGTQFSSITRNLIQARIQDNVNLQQQLEESRRHAEEMEHAIAAERDSQRLLSQQLARYQELHGLLPS
ncbi:hypothetical protein JR316_0010220 [Psilocybe cubensis]|uniref:Uncharacterized protein n=2 Tax=Psilocybe cubensis TaxID=181762 RepID=A0A8H7XRR9_PSICU|nr:hypothetical protein JR316_0010220 [Psilocybe cubensis]KAH9477987.1 hypothetical protein JR316_0010220 [Psilocybe cubensis]